MAAVPSLRALAASRHDVAAVVTREDAVLGRKRVPTPTPVSRAATELGLPVVTANRLVGDVVDSVRGIAPDLGVIVAYGGFVREPLLSIPRLGWINLHFSLLPRWRGAAPVQRAIMAGDELTGATVFQLVDELDAGPTLGTMTQAIGRNETAGHLLDSLAETGAVLLTTVIDAMSEGTARSQEQSGDVSFAPKLTLEDGHIVWSESAATIHNRIRGVTPEPGAFMLVGGVRIKILDASIARDARRTPPGLVSAEGGAVRVGTATEPIELIEIQPAGRNPMKPLDWWRGRRGDSQVIAR